MILLLAFAPPATPQALVHGLVETIEDDRRQPVAEAAVRAFVDDEAVAVAFSGRDGRYALEVPAETFELRLVKTGYVVARSGGLALPRRQRSCPAAGDCGAVDFLLEKAAAVEIWLSDPSGDPLPDAFVHLRAEVEGAGPSRNGQTDDRGVKRFYGLPPGPYRLDVRIPAPNPSIGRLFAAAPLTVDLRAGEDAPVYVATQRADAETFSLQGVIENFDQLERGLWLQMRNLTTGEMSTLPQNGQEVNLPRLTRGDYALTLFGPGGVLLLGRLRLDENKTGLTLRPSDPPSLIGYVKFEDDAPDQLRLRLRSEEGWMWTWIEINRRNPNFRFGGQPPGRYRLENGSQDGFLLEQRDVVLTEGGSERVELTFSGRFARVRGRIRASGPGEIRVELSGPSGSREQVLGPAMVFRFEQLAPGEYTLCAGAAGEPCPEERRRKLTVEAGDDIELDLGASR